MTPEMNEAIKIIQSDFNTALKMTRTTVLERVNKTNNKNWYLFFGLPNSGKSSLLNAALKECEFNLQHAVSELCEYWHMEHAVFVDINSNTYMNNDTAENNVVVLNKLFDEFKAKKIAPSGVIITAPIQELQNDQKLYDEQSSYIRENIKHLNDLFPGISISIVATKSDLILGFNEFFDDMGPEERDNSCGIQFPMPPYEDTLPKLCDDAFSELLMNLNDRLLRRVHQESDLQKKHLIKDFPVQIELLKPYLGHLLNEILPSIDVTLNGIYFTSTSQTKMPISHISKSLKDVYDLQPITTLPIQSNNKQFFIKGLFENFINAKQSAYTPKTISWINYTATTLAVACIISGSVIYKHYQNSQNNVAAVNKLLKSAENNYSQKPFQRVVTKLYALQQTYNTINAEKRHLTRNSKNKHDNLMNQAQTTFWNVLTQDLFVELNDALEQELSKEAAQKNTDFIKLFSTLATYLMLHDPSEFDQQHVIEWFDHYWETNNISVAEQGLLHKYLQLLTSRPLPQQKINFELMLKAQEALKQKTPMQMAVVLLSERFHDHPVTLVSEDADLVIDKNYNTIPSLYTKARWTEVNNTIKDVSKLISKYLWTIDDTSVDQQTLTAKLQEQYCTHYVEQWFDVLGHVKFHSHKRFNDYLVSLNLLNSSRSPLKSLIYTVKNNTSEIPGDDTFNSLVSSQFQAINAYNIDNPITPYNKAIDNLSEHMNAIGNAKNPVATAYARARLRISHKAKQDALTDMFAAAQTMPEPFQTWAHQVADNGWKLILSGAHTYINAIWTHFVVPEYNQSIKDKFPVYQDSHEDIRLEDFTQFFAANGIIDTFYHNYLSDFVDENKGWVWKKVDGRSIEIPQKTLENFLRAMLIQKMLFTHTGDRPQITFTLKQTALSPRVKEFSLLVDNQTIEYGKEADHLTAITWPGSGVTDNELRFVNIDGKITKLDFNDAWGWYRVMKLAQITPTASTKTVTAVFKFGGQTLAQFEVSSDDVINPFTPDIINLFRCPERL